MNSNIKQIFQKVLQNLSVVGVSLSVFNTISNQTTVKSLRANLEVEKVKNQQLTIDINNLVTNNINNDKVETVLRKSLELQENNINKLETLNNKISNLIEHKLFDGESVSTVNNSMKDINSELLELFNKIDDCVKNSLIDLDIFNNLQTYINSLNYFQSLALSHLFAIILILILLIDLMVYILVII